MNVLFLPIFSMRSYDTGHYAITKDGNFQLTLSRILASDFDSILIALPVASTDFQEFLNRLLPHIENRDVRFTFLKYGANAVETRKTFWTDNKETLDHIESEGAFDLVVTDITGFSDSVLSHIPFVNNFNITKLPELNRPYIDQFFDLDLKNIEASLFTTVINPRQRDYILEVAPHLKDKVIAYTKVAHQDLLPLDHRTRILKENRTIFWPFRISDKAYQFEAFLKVFEEHKLYETYALIITDPNDTYKGNHSFVSKIKLFKDEYYKMLQLRPIVIMLDDIDTVLHPGTIEFMYYGCNVITLENTLVNNEHQVKCVEVIHQKLAEVGYNTNTNLHEFVYLHNEISKIYNKNNIHEKNKIPCS